MLSQPIGALIGGGAHPVFSRELPHGFSLSVPFARAINPITKTNWEGVGVKPHIEVPADEALEVALKQAREAIAERASRDEKRADGAGATEAAATGDSSSGK